MALPNLGRGRAGRGRAVPPNPVRPTLAPLPGPRLPATATGLAWPRPPIYSEYPLAAVTRHLGSTHLGDGNESEVASRGGMRGRRTLNEVAIRTRPESCISKRGSSGQPCEVLTNYFKLVKKTEWVIYQYRVDFSAEEDRIMVRRAWLRQHKNRLGNSYLFEGTMMFSSNLIVRKDEPLTLTSVKQEDNSPVLINIKLVGVLDPGNVTYIMVFNLLVRRCMGKLDLKLIGRNLYDPQGQHNIREFNMSVWPGYLTSIRQHENDVLMCCDIIHKVMRTETAYAVMMQFKSGDFKNQFSNAIIGEVVLTPYNNKFYRVDDVCFETTASSKFATRDGDISYIDYYKTRYNITIRDPRQPLLLSKLKAKDIRGGKTQHVLLVPELCTMTGITEPMRNNYHLMKALAQVIHISPRERMTQLEIFNQRMQTTPAIEEELKGWDMALGKDLVKAPARLLPPENIIFGDNQIVNSGPTADWTRSSQGMPMLQSAPVESWVVVVPERLGNDADKFVRTMRQVSQKMRFDLPEPSIHTIQRDNAGDIVRAIEDICARSRPTLIFFAVSNNNADRYSAIKKKCYIDRAISSQVVVGRNLTGKNLMTVATKVAIQISTKLGGAPWGVQIPLRGCMIVGFDVCHDASDKSKSFGAMVATSNDAMTSWYCNATAHTSGEELSNSIALDIQKAVKRWVTVNGNPPGRIIVYRDGVGDGQIDHVHGHEVGCVKRSLAAMYGETPFRLGYILVTKRINTRIFLPNKTNPGPGLVVDDVITIPEKYDFFLVSQHSKQGTVMPTCYNIIEDNLGLKTDHIQMLTFKLTHLYYNLSSSVRVPAPVQYAHRLAFMVSQSLHRQPNAQLCDRLFFI